MVLSVFITCLLNKCNEESSSRHCSQQRSKSVEALIMEVLQKGT